tara:strand:- start:603 stop:800 length:198 start_codon:yes stop_codon:yes gene_type:complete
MSVEVKVRNNNIEGAIRVLKKKMLNEGVLKELKRRKYFEKPSKEKLLAKRESSRVFKKLMEKNQI